MSSAEAPANHPLPPGLFAVTLATTPDLYTKLLVVLPIPVLLLTLFLPE